TGIGKPDASVRVHHDVVRSVEWFVLPALCQHGEAAVMLMAHDSARGVFAGNEPPFPVKGVAVAVVRWRTEHAYMSIFLQPASLEIVGNVTPDQIPPHGAPGRTFRPSHSVVKPLDGRVAYLVFAEALIEDHDVPIRIALR